MTQLVPSVTDHDPALVHQFIRLVGRRPTPEELRRYQQHRSRAALRLPLGLRRGAARLVARL
jgi:hypothetical protein